MRKLTIQEQEVLKAAILVLHSASKEKIRTPQNLDVADLTIDCLSAVLDDAGNKKIFITQDDEGNGYHQLFYSLDYKPSKSILKMLKDEDSCFERYKNEEIALLG